MTVMMTCFSMLGMYTAVVYIVRAAMTAGRTAMRCYDRAGLHLHGRMLYYVCTAHAYYIPYIYALII